MGNPEHTKTSEQAEPQHAEPLTLDKQTLKDLDPSSQDAAEVKGGMAATPVCSESCRLDGCSNQLGCGARR